MQTFMGAIKIYKYVISRHFGDVYLSCDQVNSLADEMQCRILKDDSIQKMCFSLSFQFHKFTLFDNISNSVILKIWMNKRLSLSVYI